MSERKLLHRAEYAAYQVVAGITQRLPLRALRVWGRGVGWLAYHLMPGRRALTLDNLARALPELDSAERRRVARECFEVQSATYHEQVWAMRRGQEIADRFEIVGREHFEAARERGKGVFVLTGHYGCWELAGYPLGRWLGTLYIVARPQNNPLIAAHFESLRERNGNVQIDRARAGTRMLKVLKKGGAIGVAIDQRVRPSQAVLVPFLGRYAWTSRLPAYLSTVTGCAAVPMVCEPLPNGGYRMTFDAPILPEGKGDDEIERLTRRYVAALEPYIRARPALWLWLHSRWRRTRPQRRPEAIARLVAEAGLPAAAPLHEAARRSPASSPLRRLDALVSDAFLENCRHLLLVASGAAAAGAIGEAFARRGHATRYFTLEALCESLGSARDEGHLDATLRELDATPLVVVAEAEARALDAARLELLGRFLRHRLDRGSVLLATSNAADWRDAEREHATAGESMRAFLDACEVVDLSGPAGEALVASGAPGGSRSAPESAAAAAASATAGEAEVERDTEPALRA